MHKFSDIKLQYFQGVHKFLYLKIYGRVLSLISASWGLGRLALCQGDLHKALYLLERAMGICQNADRSGYFPMIAVALGAAYTLGGRVADAVPLLTQATTQATAM